MTDTNHPPADLDAIAEALAISIDRDAVEVLRPEGLSDTIAVYNPNLIVDVHGSAAGTRVADVLERSLPASAPIRLVKSTEAGLEVHTLALERLRVFDIDVGTAVFVDAVDARVEAMSALYAADVMKQEDVDTAHLSKRAATLAEGAWSNRVDLDQVISKVSKSWRVERMPAVDRNILRLGVFELVHTDLPTGVVIDEAVTLAKDYSTRNSASFVNGVLDAIAEVR